MLCPSVLSTCIISCEFYAQAVPPVGRPSPRLDDSEIVGSLCLDLAYSKLS
jgi:hypothetical protein